MIKTFYMLLTILLFFGITKKITPTKCSLTLIIMILEFVEREVSMIYIFPRFLITV